jgi:NAD(P)-dependent dehydrogenase (short-subunit alcohol dehydrogenase family)
MGAVEARMFAQEGAKVVIGDLLVDEGRQVEGEIIKLGGECAFVHLDVTDERVWQDAVAATVARFGKLDILGNNAGIARINTVEDTTSDEWDLVLDINAKGVFLGVKSAIPELRKVGGGSIVNISSIAGLTGGRTSSYAARKGAVRLLSKSTAIQYASEGIRCSSVHPGVIETPMTSPIMLNTREDRELNEARHPMGRIGHPEDIAYGVLFLASDESSFMTGSELVIDGGLTAQ